MTQCELPQCGARVKMPYATAPANIRLAIVEISGVTIVEIVS
jgi:hypothetical protein